MASDKEPDVERDTRKILDDPYCPFDETDIYSDAVLDIDLRNSLACPLCGCNTMKQRYRVINGGPSSDISHWQQ